MNKKQLLNKILDCKVIPIIRTKHKFNVIKICEALLKGGINNIEITMNTLGVMEIVEKLLKEFSTEIQVGIGTVLTKEMAKQAIKAGAHFIVTPMFNSEIINYSNNKEVPVFSGAFTPTEIFNSYEAGADIIKVFPANVLGMDYFKALKGPFPRIPLMPTGGVRIDNAGEWIKAGAKMVGIGGGLLDDKVLAAENYKLVTENVRKILESVNHQNV
jgi:2-dehydro-3-deoxyphosphogluconate aldolase/(4S)-4-hydroxy-2-oxoglutarate aldolase